MFIKDTDNFRLAEFYRNQIERDFFRFWNRAIDRNHGGIFTCFNNSGTALFSTNKYTWSQGRFVWIWSKLFDLTDRKLLTLDKAGLKTDLDRTVHFLERHVFLPNKNCVFLMDETGKWMETAPGKGYDTSFYADCFVALGFSAYARTFRDRHYADIALETYRNIVRRVREGGLRSEPYPIPRGYKFHSVSMMMLHVSEDLVETLESLDDTRCDEVESNACEYMDEVMNVFYNTEDGTIAEAITPEGRSKDNILGRHLNPGHSIEDMWFVLRFAKHRSKLDYISKAAKGVKSAIRIGWDDEFGGLFRFVDMAGGKPRGEETGGPYEALVLSTWDTKLWWPHSEMLYATLLSYHLTGDEEFISLYNRAHQYVFNTFPDKDYATGEWIQIRDRKGNPINKVVALPVKDPYHILRDMLLIVELMEAMRSNG